MNQISEKKITGSIPLIQRDKCIGQNPVTHGWKMAAAVVFLWQAFLIPGSAQIPEGCDLPLFPFPASCLMEGGQTTATRWAWSPESIRFLPNLSEDTRPDLSPLPSGAPGTEGTIHLFLDTISIQQPESYLLVIDARDISITASYSTGFLHGLRTLAQLRQADGAYPQLRIVDQPRFSYRGMHLDVSRHFFPVTFIKRYLDLLARYKFNTFHWHLTDDQGWRLEIKSFPKLTEIGAWRNGSQQGPYARMVFDTVRYGGYYTQDEVRDIVAYGFERGITIIPEIEMPGHAIAALAAYPEYSCSGGPFSVERGWGIFEDVFCTREETFLFIEKVLNESSLKNPLQDQPRHLYACRLSNPRIVNRINSSHFLFRILACAIHKAHICRKNAQNDALIIFRRIFRLNAEPASIQFTASPKARAKKFLRIR